MLKRFFKKLIQIIIHSEKNLLFTTFNNIGLVRHGDLNNIILDLSYSACVTHTMHESWILLLYTLSQPLCILISSFPHQPRMLLCAPPSSTYPLAVDLRATTRLFTAYKDLKAIIIPKFNWPTRVVLGSTKASNVHIITSSMHRL